MTFLIYDQGGRVRNHHKELRKNQHLEIKYKLDKDGVSMNEQDIKTE